MKNLILAAMLSFLLIACKNEERYTQNSSEIETFKEVIKAYDAKDWKTLTSHFSDTANIYFNSSKSFKSPQLPDYHKKTDSYYVSRGFETEGQEYEMVKSDDGKTWVNFWGTWKGVLEATSKEFTLQIHLTAEFIDGKIVTEYGYWDSHEIASAINNIESNSNNIKTIEKIYDNFEKGNIPAFLALLDEKVEWNEAENFIYADNSPYIGPEAFSKGVLDRIGADWEYWKIKDLKLLELKNGMVLATGRYNAKNKKNGKILDSQVAHLWSLENGKIIKFQQYTDTKQAFDKYQ